MAAKIVNLLKNEHPNCKIHPVLYHFYLIIRDTLNAEIVHRRKRTSNTCIEIIFYCDDFLIVTGRLNTLPQAEKWGYWVIAHDDGFLHKLTVFLPQKFAYMGKK